MTRRKPGNLPASEGTYTPSGQKVRMETLQDEDTSLRRLSVPAPCVGRFFFGPPALRVRNIPAVVPPCGPSGRVRTRTRTRGAQLRRWRRLHRRCFRLRRHPGSVGGVGRGQRPRTVVDDIGQEIYLEAPPQRILSVGLAMDNILLSVTDPPRVVGVTTLATDPQWSYVADVSPHMTLVQQLNAEQVLALAPDIVLVAVERSRRRAPAAGVGREAVHVRRLRHGGRRAGQHRPHRGDHGRRGPGAGAHRRVLPPLRTNRVPHRGQGAAPGLVVGRLGRDGGSGMSIHDIIEMAGGVNAAARHGIRGWHTSTPRRSCR